MQAPRSETVPPLSPAWHAMEPVPVLSAEDSSDQGLTDADAGQRLQR